MSATPPIWKKPQGRPECSATERTGTDADVPQEEGHRPLTWEKLGAAKAGRASGSSQERGRMGL